MRNLLNSLAVPSCNDGCLTFFGLLGIEELGSPADGEGPCNDPGGYHSPENCCWVINGCIAAC